MTLFRNDIKTIVPYRYEPDDSGKIALDLNENRLLETVGKRFVLEIEAKDLFSYRTADSTLRAIADSLGVQPANVLLTAGADDGLRTVMTAVMSPGEKALILQPGYSYYSVLLRLLQARIVSLRYRSDFTFPEKEFLRALRRQEIRLVILTNPHNPLGCTQSEHTLLGWAREFPDRVFLIDETYADFGSTSVCRKAPNFPNLLVVRSYSKFFGLAGLRIGAVVGAAQSMEVLRKVALPFPVSHLSRKFLLKFLLDRSLGERLNSRLQREKARLVGDLQKMGFYAVAGDTNFVLLYLGEKAVEAVEALKRRGILVKDLGDQPLLEGWIRVTVGTRDDHRAFLRSLGKTGFKTALLFDLDGVLVEANEIYLENIVRTFRKLTGRPAARREVIALRKRVDCSSDDQALDRLLKRAGVRLEEGEAKAIFDEEIRRTKALRRERLIFSRRSLRTLSQRFLLGVVTSRPSVEAQESLTRLGIRKHFSTVVTADDVRGRRKPDPAGLRLAMTRLSAPIAIAIGDHPADLEAARRAGVLSFGMKSEFLSRREALRFGANNFFRRADELMEEMGCVRQK